MEVAILIGRSDGRKVRRDGWSGEGEQATRPADGPPGFNPLFIGVLISVALGILAGLLAGDPTFLRSNLVFRVVVGGIVAVVSYGVTAALWLAWHRRLLKKLTVAGHGVEPGDATDVEVRERDLEVAEFMGTTTSAIEEIKRRVEALERQARRSFKRVCGPPSDTFQTLRGTATIDGVGFFDFIHGQTGHAPNGIELHPVTRFRATSC